MGKRFILGVVILAVLLAVGLGTQWGMTALHRPGEKLLQQAQELALSERLEQAAALAAEAKQRWEQYWTFTAAAADHSPMDEVDGLFGELTVYARQADVTHFAATCARLSQMLRAMYDAHSITLWNFF